MAAPANKDSDGDYDMVPERLVLDCGGVLSVPSSSGKEKYDGNDIYKAAIPGAYAFCQKFMHTYGADSLQVISRVNFPESKNHWVVRFCSSLGIDERQVHLVSERRDKGPKARSLGCSVAVDDQCACLYSICVHCYDILDSVKPLILFNESGYRRSGAKWDDYVQERVTRTTSWLTVATMCGVNTDGWEELGKLGPPHCWHQQATVKRWFLMMAPAAPKSKASAASAGPAEKKPAASAEPAEKKPAASAEPAEKKPAASAEPAERKEHDEPAASAEQERDTSAAPAENDTSSAVSAEEKKEKEKHKKIQQEKKTSSHDENYSYSYYSEEEVEDDDHKEEEEESSSSLSVHVVDADNPPPVPQQAKTKTPAASAGKKDKKATKDKSHKKDKKDKKEKKTPADPAGKVCLKPNPVSEMEELLDRASGYARRAESAARDAEAAASSCQGPQGAPGVSWQGRHPQSEWMTRKRARAEAYRATGGQSRLTKVTATPYCKRCSRNQPGAYCPGGLCRQCCELEQSWDRHYWCEQHRRY